MGGGFAACLPFLTKNKDKIEKIVKIATEKPGAKADKPAEPKPTVEATAPGAGDVKPAADAPKPADGAAPAAGAAPADAKPKDDKPKDAAAQAADFYGKHKKEIGSAVDMASKFMKKH